MEDREGKLEVGKLGQWAGRPGQGTYQPCLPDLPQSGRYVPAVCATTWLVLANSLMSTTPATKPADVRQERDAAALGAD